MAAIIDYRGKSPEKTTFGIPLITAKIVKGGRIMVPDEFIAPDQYDKWMRRGLPQRGDVVMTTEAPLGEIAQLDGTKVALAQRLITLRGKEGMIGNDFLKFLMQSRFVQEELKSRATGTTVLGIRQSELRRVRLPVPPIEEQRRIAEVLGALDDKIELNRRMNENLEATARGIFKSWFVDFDPVRAKAEGRQPVGMSADVAALFPGTFHNTELGALPKGWCVGPLLRIADLLSGGTPKTDRAEYWNGDILWASAKDVSQSSESILVHTERSITNTGLEESATQLISAWCTVVVARGATTGRMVLFGREMAMNQTCYALRSSTNTPLALYCQLRSEIGSLVHAAHGSVFDTITTSTFENSQVVIPPTALLNSFDDVVRPLFQLMLSNTNESLTLANLRDTLLPKLLSGEVRLATNESVRDENRVRTAQAGE